MKHLLRSAAGFLLLGSAAYGQLILGDDYNVAGSGTGFVLGSGVNSGINPPTTRMTGSAAANMRYILPEATKPAANYSIATNAVQVAAASGSGRFTFSNDGTTAFDFGSLLGTGLATPANPVVYDVTLSLANYTGTGNQNRFSFALATAENNANFWDFGIQLYRSGNNTTRYTIGKRIDRVSYTTATDSTGSTDDKNAAITTLGANTFGTTLDFLMRVTDAGAEATTFNSRVQLSMDGGSTWFYDTQTDTDLTATGFRFDTTSRYFSFDIAGSTIASYDNFSLTLVTAAVPEPSTLSLSLVAAFGALAWRRRQK